MSGTAADSLGEGAEEESEATVRIAILGSGFAGLCAAIRLTQSGFEDFLVLEKSESLGGTWRDNTYPGCACDVPSLLYSFSFAPNPNWSEAFSSQADIRDYLECCAQRFGIVPHIRFGCEVLDAVWDGQHWRLRTTTGTCRADMLIAAAGPLSDPSLPNISGLPSFAGDAFHSARWNSDVDLTGRRVGVIGTGASAVQFVPEIAPVVEHLTVFQRTPPWVLPRRDRTLHSWERELHRRFPALQQVRRGAIRWGRELLLPGLRHPRLAAAQAYLARRHLLSSIADPALRATLTPSYRIGCKRILLSNTFYPALTRPNVEVVAEPIARVLPHAVVTTDGVEHPADILIFGTGFHVSDPPIASRISRTDGTTLADVWGGSPRAYAGTTVVGFPNLFLLLGPNTGLGHTSMILMVEAQVEHVLAALRHCDATGADTIEPTPEAERTFVHDVDRRMRGTVWSAGGCQSWYRDETGRISAIWPGSTWAFGRRVARFDAGAYRTTPVSVVGAESRGAGSEVTAGLQVGSAPTRRARLMASNGARTFTSLSK